MSVRKCAARFVTKNYSRETGNMTGILEELQELCGCLYPTCIWLNNYITKCRSRAHCQSACSNKRSRTVTLQGGIILAIIGTEKHTFSILLAREREKDRFNG